MIDQAAAQSPLVLIDVFGRFGQRDGAVLLLHGAASGVAVHGQGDHQPRPRHHLRHRGRHRVLLFFLLI